MRLCHLNRQQIASFRDKTITIIDLETLSQTIFDTQEFPQIVAWGGDNTIYYSSITPVRDLMADLTVDEKDELLALDEFIFDLGSLTSNSASIHRLNLINDTDETIYETDLMLSDN